MKTVLTQVLELIDSEVIRLSKVKGEHKKVSESCANQLVILKMKINNADFLKKEEEQISKWISVSEMVNHIITDNTMLLFDNGDIRRFEEEHPFAESTHFFNLPQPPKED